jgi:hypothetical protein
VADAEISMDPLDVDVVQGDEMPTASVSPSDMTDVAGV